MFKNCNKTIFFFTKIVMNILLIDFSTSKRKKVYMKRNDDEVVTILTNTIFRLLQMYCNTRFLKHRIIVGLLFYFMFHKRRYRIFIIVGKSNPVLLDSFQVGAAVVTNVGNCFKIRMFRKKDPRE